MLDVFIPFSTMVSHVFQCFFPLLKRSIPIKMNGTFRSDPLPTRPPVSTCSRTPPWRPFRKFVSIWHPCPAGLRVSQLAAHGLWSRGPSYRGTGLSNQPFGWAGGLLKFGMFGFRYVLEGPSLMLSKGGEHGCLGFQENE